MGCNFVTRTYDGKLSENELRAAVDEAISQSLYEDGASYSGEIGMANDLLIETEHFFYHDYAYAWLEDHCVKWEEARAVKFKDQSGNEFWLVGCACAS